MRKLSLSLSALALTTLPGLALAQETAAAAPADITPYIFTTLLFLVGGFMVFWMAAGFAMLEAGLVRSKNVTMQLTKNIALFSIAAIMYWLVGFTYKGGGTTTLGKADFNVKHGGAGTAVLVQFQFERLGAAS